MQPTREQSLAYGRFAIQTAAGANREWSEQHPDATSLGFSRVRLHAELFARASRADQIHREDFRESLSCEGYCALLFARDPEWVRRESQVIAEQAIAERRDELHRRLM